MTITIRQFNKCHTEGLNASFFIIIRVIKQTHEFFSNLHRTSKQNQTENSV